MCDFATDEAKEDAAAGADHGVAAIA